jgi:hypothetical protein
MEKDKIVTDMVMKCYIKMKGPVEILTDIILVICIILL